MNAGDKFNLWEGMSIKMREGLKMELWQTQGGKKTSNGRRKDPFSGI